MGWEWAKDPSDLVEKEIWCWDMGAKEGKDNEIWLGSMPFQRSSHPEK